MYTGQKREGAVQQEGVLVPHKHTPTHKLKCTNKQSLLKMPGIRSEDEAGFTCAGSAQGHSGCCGDVVSVYGALTESEAVHYAL